MNGIKLVKYSAVIAAAVLLASTGRVNAMTVGWQNDAGETAITLNGGTVGLAVGDIVELGIFKNNMSNAAISALFLGVPGNGTAIQSAFNVWASGAIGDGGSGGTVLGAFAENSGPAGAGYFTSNAFLVVFNVTSVGGISGATQMGVFKGPSTGATSGDNWLFPATDGSTANFAVADITGANVLIGSYGSGTYDDSAANGATGWYGSGANALELAQVVPEPSTYMLVGMGLLGAW